MQRSVLLLLVVLLVPACGLAPKTTPRIQVTAETLPWVDPATWQTWTWWRGPLEGTGVGTDEGLFDWRIRQAVAANLAARGYTEAAPGTRADFVMSYDVSRDVQSTSSFRDYLNYRAEGGSQDMGDAFMGYEEGQLLLRATDTRSRRVGWRGRATAVLDGRVKPDLIDQAVADVLARFPARPGS